MVHVNVHTPTARDYGGGFGGVYDGVVAGGYTGGAQSTLVDEWNGVSWTSATAYQHSTTWNRKKALKLLE